MIFVSVTSGMRTSAIQGSWPTSCLKGGSTNNGYFQSKLVPGLSPHTKVPIQFVLTVGDFGVKFVGRKHAEHLYQALCQHYKVTTDWTGDRYIGIHLRWALCQAPGSPLHARIRAKALTIFPPQGHTPPKSTFFHTLPIKYGARKQYAKGPSTSPKLDKQGKEVHTTSLWQVPFYGRAVDSTVLTRSVPSATLNPAEPTKATLAQTQQLMDYLASQEEAVLTYNRKPHDSSCAQWRQLPQRTQTSGQSWWPFFLSHA
eukprot:CCRYP_019905-RA/>CCRYP_019905-RA protein AED:0.58 eAED:0.15 QI:0/-1/0/1/-1/1/1/0/256